MPTSRRLNSPDLRIGHRVRCEVDMYGSRREYEGRITGFTMGTGQTLALLPPQNATGNFVKIVQRLPVRVELTELRSRQGPVVRRPVGRPVRLLQGTAHGAARRGRLATALPTSARPNGRGRPGNLANNDPASRRPQRPLKAGHEAASGIIVHPGSFRRSPRVSSVTLAPSALSRPAINPWFVAAAVVVPTFMEVLDTTIANVALRYIAGGLSASNVDSEWVLTSYLAANATILPITGWLSAHLGRRNYFLLSIAVFTIASGLCGMATSLEQLILFRVIQGLGGGGLQPSSQAILLDSFPPEKQGAAQTMFGIAALLAPVVGPTLGGYLTVTVRLALDLLHQCPCRRPRLPGELTSWLTTRTTSSKSGRSCAADRSISITSAWGCSS